MNVSNVGAAYRNLSAFASGKTSSGSATSPLTSAINTSASDASSVASASPGGTYDFTSMTSRELTKTTNDLFNSGRISEDDVHAVLRLTLSLPRLVNGELVATPEPSTQLHNYIAEARQILASDKAFGYAVPGQIEAEQSLIEKFMALQGTPKGGIDKTV